MAISVETFFLDPSGQGTLQARIQQMVAEGILSGRLRQGEKLPSTRRLASHLGVSRITVTLAYTELLSNDYLTSKGRSGYFVSENAPEPPRFPPRSEVSEAVDWSRAIGQRFSGGAEHRKPADWSRYKYPFIYGQTDPRLFDHANWRLCALQALGQRNFSALTSDYFDQDDPELLEFVARHSLPRRGIAARPEEILITMGAQNALWLAAQVLLTQRRTAAIEEPGYPSLRDILRQSRCHLAHVPLDTQGIRAEAIPDETDVIFTTPSHQCPTTVTMSLERRKALLERASELDALIVEDDYEFEISFGARPSPALKSLDREGRVVYVGSFSKSLFPGLRLGYLVGAEPFIREARALRASVLRHVPGHVQRTAANFLRLGHYDALIRRMSTVLESRRRTMSDALSLFGLHMADHGGDGGSAFWMEAPAHVDTEMLAEKLGKQSVLIEPGRPFFGNSNAPHRFYRLGYSSIPSSRIHDGVRLIAEQIENWP